MEDSAKIPAQPTYALKVINNWDGERDILFVFAFKNNDKFYNFEDGKSILIYDGDEILEQWRLDK